MTYKYWLALIMLSLCVTFSADAVKSTHTYKMVDGVPLQLDAFIPDDVESPPVVMWIHGGALVMDGRGTIDPVFATHVLAKGCALITIDYRLAPEAKVPDIVRDVQDAYTWIRTRGPEILGVDGNNIAVAGGSAGGYLTLMSGLACEPRPKALAALYGYGDIMGTWLTEPYEHYRELFPIVTVRQVQEAISDTPVVAGAINIRGAIYLYGRQQGCWPYLVTGYHPATNPEKLRPWCPVQNVTADYPPTVLIHGRLDHDVPWEQSRDMAEALKKAGVDHLLLTIENADHGFVGGNPGDINTSLEKAAEFVAQRLHTSPSK